MSDTPSHAAAPTPTPAPVPTPLHAGPRLAPRGATLAKLALGALGVVYGDIGTSPLYALKECFAGTHSVPPEPQNVIGVVSLVFWAMTFVVTFKYLSFVMRADNRGEGGILALLALVGQTETTKAGRRALLIMGLFGAALLYGDGVITPAISVLGAVEGVAVAAAPLERLVVPLSVAILVVLFVFQKRGTAMVGAVFGPIMVVWFVTIALLGIRGVALDPGILRSVNPAHGVRFFAAHGPTATQDEPARRAGGGVPRAAAARRVPAMRRVALAFGQAVAFLDRSRRVGWLDLALAAALGSAIYGLVGLAREWTGALRPAVEIDLSLRALPGYALLSLSRGLAAYVLSLLFTLGYGYWAARDRVAERVLIPALDILQSIPVLGFMPGLVLGLVAAFPHSNVGLELASVIMIFTGQAWNMTFSFYHSLKSIPPDLSEAATFARFGRWQRFRWLELPFAAIGLVWNSMMSMAGGWFFLMVSEAFVLGDRDFRLPGLGSYMSVAVAAGDGRAMLAAVVAMTAMIVALDQLLWRPLVVWAQKFRVEESGQVAPMASWFLDVLRRSELVQSALRAARRVAGRLAPAPAPPPPGPVAVLPARRARLASGLSLVPFLLLLALIAWGAFDLVLLLRRVPPGTWGDVAGAAGLTLGRVLLATALGTLWTVPAGLAIGLSPRLSRGLQPVVQVVASFPAPMLFPAVVAALRVAGVSLGWGSVVLMLLGTQWYVLFNVIAGATAIPADLREAARLFRMGTLQRFRVLYLPAVFPYLVTGWVTAAGGAWNASIVAEYLSFKGEVLATHGIGARISMAAASGDLAVLAASIATMAAMVAAFNRLVWRRLNAVAERRFALSR